MTTDDVFGRLLAHSETIPSLCRRLNIPPGRRFISQGESDSIVYLLLAGTARVSKTDSTAEHEIARLTAPAIVGELSTFADGRTADVTAIDAIEALAIEASSLRDLCALDPEFAKAISALAQRRLAETAELSDGEGGSLMLARMRALAFGVAERERAVLTALLDLAERKPALLRRETPAIQPQAPFIERGQKLTHVYVIASGSGEVRMGDGRAITVGPGNLLGEIAALSHAGLATASVFLAPGTELVAVAREEFRAIRGAAESLAISRLNEQFARPLSAEIRDTLRSIRDQNVEALILRAALDIVHSPTGIFAGLNAQGEEWRTSGETASVWGVIRQKCTLIQAVASLLRASRNRSEIAEVVAEIQSYGLSGIPALKLFKGEAAVVREEWLERIGSANAALFDDALTYDNFTIVRERFELMEWLDSLLTASGAIQAPFLPGKDPLEKFRLFMQSREGIAHGRVLEELDNVFEQLMEAGLAGGSERVASDLEAIRFQNVQARPMESVRSAAVELPAEHPNHLALRETRARLDGGERSAIGGADYATQRFPRVLLDRIVEGRLAVVVFDGSRAGTLDACMRFGPQARTEGVQPRYMTTEVQGLDGGGGRTLVTFRDDRGDNVKAASQVLVLHGFGAARQRHNADSILLYERHRRRVPADHLILLSEGISYQDRMRADIRRALDAERARESILGVTVNPDRLPTSLLILQNPKEFEAALAGPEGRDAELRYAAGALFAFYVGYARTHDGLRRFVIPKVGGKGLYGDTAGAFVEACFTAGIPALGRHVFFNGTAGGFIDAAPGSTVICPRQSIAQYENRGLVRYGIQTVFDARPLPDALSDGIRFTSDHVSVGAPGDETYELIREFVGQGFTSIDVEGGPIMAAVARLNRDRGPADAVTFTPLYTFSDNPLNSEHDRFDSLAIMGPFFEGARFNAELWRVLRQLLIQDNPL